MGFSPQVLKELDRPVLYSISPGTSVTPTMAKEVSQLVNMYRITGDDWDTWKDVVAHFDISRSSFMCINYLAVNPFAKFLPFFDVI